MSTEVQEVQWSDLQRDPKSVAELADAGDVRVRRRDGVNLLLIREDRVAAAGAGAVTAARTLRNLVTHMPPEKFVESLLDEFPWLQYLPVEEIREFCLDFVRGALAAAELGQWEVLEQVIREWKATASIHADPTLAEQLRKPINDDLGPVPSPKEDVTGAS
jgi:hypothetical protein